MPDAAQAVGQLVEAGLAVRLASATAEHGDMHGIPEVKSWGCIRIITGFSCSCLCLCCKLLLVEVHGSSAVLLLMEPSCLQGWCSHVTLITLKYAARPNAGN